MDKNKNITNSKASIMCWEFQNLMAKFHINVKEDVIYHMILQGFSKQVCWKTNNDESSIQN